MQVAIVGFPLSGKSTLFDLICMASSGRIVLTGDHRAPLNTRLATVHIADPRLSLLHEAHPDKRLVAASIDLLDFPPLQIKHKDARYAELVASISKCDALTIVIRAFENDAYPHPLGSISPERDVQEIIAELEIRDLEILEKRIERITKSGKKHATERAREEQELLLLKRLLPYFEEKKHLDDMMLSADEEKMLRGFQFFRLKPRYFILNIGEEFIRQESAFAGFEESHPNSTRLSCRIELEVASLSGEEREGFANEYGLERDAVQSMLRSWLDCFGMISFYTIGKDEVRAWLVPKGIGAVGAAGKIHADIARGFISAEVVTFDDFKRCKTMKDVKAQGRLRLEGKEYRVQDGDIIYFRFNI